MEFEWMPVSCLTSFLQKAHITFQILVRRNLEKLEYIKQATGARINLQFEEIHFLIWKNIFCNWYKYILRGQTLKSWNAQNQVQVLG